MGHSCNPEEEKYQKKKTKEPKISSKYSYATETLIGLKSTYNASLNEFSTKVKPN
jgi:hypothetical protein